MIPLLLLLAATASEITVVEKTVTVPPGEVKGLNLILRQRRAVIDVFFRVVEPEGEIKIGLIGPGDAASGARGRPNEYLRMLPEQREGSFRFPADETGVYNVILDNRGGARPVEVALDVKLEFGGPGTGSPGTLSRSRRATVVGMSLVLFLAVCWWSGRRLLAALRRRPPGEPPLWY